MRYGAKGVFKMETVFVDPARPPNVFYETRIINLEAPDDAEAMRRALAAFCADERAAAPQSPLTANCQSPSSLMPTRRK